MQRQLELSLQKSESRRIYRTYGFKGSQVQIFFAKPKLVGKQYSIELDNIYNLEEMGIQISSKTPSKVTSVMEEKQVEAVASAESGQLARRLSCCSALDTIISLCLIFPKKKDNPRYLQNTPPGTPNFLFDEFFMRSVRPTVEPACLLLVDNYVAHRSLVVLNYFSPYNVILLSVPPHFTHRLQSPM